jgi:hypothetical protein
MAGARAASPADDDRPLIQVALLLDTSGSMQGLIDQAKSRLWAIVNELGKARRDGLAPRLEVALFEYGNARLPSNEGFIRLVQPLTRDLDRVSEMLFALRIGGSEEYCGQVIQAALGRLQWSADATTYKAIFIAGNESFAQGSVRYQDSDRDAVARGVVVNAIFCGRHEDGAKLEWDRGASLAGGSYLSIDANRVVAVVQAPQDAEIIRLGDALNATYLAYGSQGDAGVANQIAQDFNSRGASSYVDRALTKGSRLYSNSGWDLVDALREGTPLDAIPVGDLPARMRSMPSWERPLYVLRISTERLRIQAELSRLQAERERFLAARRAVGGERSLDDAMLVTLRAQAQAKGFSF